MTINVKQLRAVTRRLGPYKEGPERTWRLYLYDAEGLLVFTRRVVGTERRYRDGSVRLAIDVLASGILPVYWRAPGRKLEATWVLTS